MGSAGSRLAFTGQGCLYAHGPCAKREREPLLRASLHNSEFSRETASTRGKARSVQIRTVSPMRKTDQSRPPRIMSAVRFSLRADIVTDKRWTRNRASLFPLYRSYRKTLSPEHGCFVLQSGPFRTRQSTHMFPTEHPAAPILLPQNVHEQNAQRRHDARRR